MTLGDCIREFREAHDMSQRQFSEKSGLSNAYVSMLEKNVNRKTGESPAPSFDTYKKVADMLRISVHELMERADESPVFLGPTMVIDPPSKPLHPAVVELLDQHAAKTENDQENQLLSLFGAMTDCDKEKLLDYAQYIVDSYSRHDKRR